MNKLKLLLNSNDIDTAEMAATMLRGKIGLKATKKYIKKNSPYSVLTSNKARVYLTSNNNYLIGNIFLMGEPTYKVDGSVILTQKFFGRRLTK